MKVDPFKKLMSSLESENFKLENNFVKPDLPATLSTCTLDGIPSSRTLYLKKIENNELFFFTNANSKKGKEISKNPNVSLCIFFKESFKQIIIEGKAYMTSFDTAQKYFQTRSKLSRAGAILSKQSSVLKNYEEFINDVHALSLKETLECPQFWRCYGVVPHRFEFWRGDKARLHLREVFELNQQNWKETNLYP